jgi:cytochrome c-type biogenesis protein CcmE
MDKRFLMARKILFIPGIISLALNLYLLVYGIASGKSYFAVPRLDSHGPEPPT